MTMLTTGMCKGYWTQTESFESVRDLINMNFDGDEAYVAQSLDTLHSSKVAPQYYNNEQALRSLIHQAYIAAIDEMDMEHKYGKGIIHTISKITASDF